MLFYGIIIKGSLRDGDITLSGANISSTSGSGPVVCRLDINMDGTIDHWDGPSSTATQLSPSTDWIIPNDAASQVYQVMFDNVAGTLGAGTTLSEGVWSPMDQDHQIVCRRTGAQGNGQTGLTFDLHIRLGSSGGVLATGAYTLQAEIT